MDTRFKKLADNLVNYSLKVKKGEKVLIEGVGVDHQLICELIKNIYKLKAFPFVDLFDQRIQREILMGTSIEHCNLMTKYAGFKMEDMDCYIGIRGGTNSFENSDVDQKNIQIYQKHYSEPVHHSIRVLKTRWVILRYPNASFAQLSKMSSVSFEDFFFNVCNLDYAKMDKAMDSLKALMEKTDKVRITGKNTDLTFSVKNMKAVKCSGSHNIPDGEIYTAPVKNSVNGKITYNAPSIHNGLSYENVCFDFKDGKIVSASANYTTELNKVLDTDEGARYVGEFSFGINPYILKPTGDILFDEKICGSIHFTPGSAYKETDNGNKSAIHWDLVYIQTPKFGGGEIYFDDVLIRKDGLFVTESLKPLNPENLK